MSEACVAYNNNTLQKIAPVHPANQNVKVDICIWENAESFWLNENLFVVMFILFLVIHISDWSAQALLILITFLLKRKMVVRLH